jgi:hypothetical protein
LLIRRRSASVPIVIPSSPAIEASLTTSLRIASRVRSAAARELRGIAITIADDRSVYVRPGLDPAADLCDPP